MLLTIITMLVIRSSELIFFKKMSIYFVFVYLAVLGLSCSIWDLIP